MIDLLAGGSDVTLTELMWVMLVFICLVGAYVVTHKVVEMKRS